MVAFLINDVERGKCFSTAVSPCGTEIASDRNRRRWMADKLSR